jgi:arginine/serine-rich splicing factor 15
MIDITKSAMRSIKYYKHVVLGVEKFIQKVTQQQQQVWILMLYLQCKPEYKVPGLYVIDSIVRQSRHQFGDDKDVFGARFAQNMLTTVKYLLTCPDNDKVCTDAHHHVRRLVY